MLELPPTTIEKALTLNLDPLKYGTIVEIGAGQEVARWFFQAGAAAGTVAKTMSAYDMNFSDEIYGAAPGRRYVSRQRLEDMLAQEFDLVVSRVEDHRPDDSTFFAFANTVSTLGYKKREECHGWMGVRLQGSPKSEPDEIILHARLLDDTNLEQQEALGILGVNLIYGAFLYRDDPEKLLRSLMDNLKWGHVELDLVDLRGPTFDALDNRLMALELVKASLTRAVMFDPEGNVVIPADALYKRSVLALRSESEQLLEADLAIFRDAGERFKAITDDTQGEPLPLAEITMSELANDEQIDTGKFLTRVTEFCENGFYVLISEFFRYFRVRQYLSRYTARPVGIVTGVEGFQKIFREDYYEGVPGGILEGLGQVFPDPTVAFVYPGFEEEARVTLDDLHISGHLQPLLSYLRERGKVVPVDDF